MKWQSNLNNFSKNTKRANKILDSGKSCSLLSSRKIICVLFHSIPGFQVYDVSTGRIKRYGKEYGKKLNESTVKDGIVFVYEPSWSNTERCTFLALRIFLNSENGIMCRPLLMQLLTVLWKVQKWARMSKTLRIYSSSLLLAYDARRLRNVLQSNWKNNRWVFVNFLYSLDIANAQYKVDNWVFRLSVIKVTVRVLNFRGGSLELHVELLRMYSRIAMTYR